MDRMQKKKKHLKETAKQNVNVNIQRMRFLNLSIKHKKAVKFNQPNKTALKHKQFRVKRENF